MVNVVGMFIVMPIMFLSGAFIAIYAFKQGLEINKPLTKKKEDNDKVKELKTDDNINMNNPSINLILDEYLNGAREGVN